MFIFSVENHATMLSQNTYTNEFSFPLPLCTSYSAIVPPYHGLASLSTLELSSCPNDVKNINISTQFHYRAYLCSYFHKSLNHPIFLITLSQLTFSSTTFQHSTSLIPYSTLTSPHCLNFQFIDKNPNLPQFT